MCLLSGLCSASANRSLDFRFPDKDGEFAPNLRREKSRRNSKSRSRRGIVNDQMTPFIFKIYLLITIFHLSIHAFQTSFSIAYVIRLLITQYFTLLYICRPIGIAVRRRFKRSDNILIFNKFYGSHRPFLDFLFGLRVRVIARSIHFGDDAMRPRFAEPIVKPVSRNQVT